MRVSKYTNFLFYKLLLGPSVNVSAGSPGAATKGTVALPVLFLAALTNTTFPPTIATGVYCSSVSRIRSNTNKNIAVSYSSYRLHASGLVLTLALCHQVTTPPLSTPWSTRNIFAPCGLNRLHFWRNHVIIWEIIMASVCFWWGYIDLLVHVKIYSTPSSKSQGKAIPAALSPSYLASTSPIICKERMGMVIFAS